ncbi:MAG: flagellar motor protein MotB [Opitutaceae bacterium]
MSKKKGGGGHHGGAWKVAYADFVTAMMALFMVLWISAQDQEILIATSQYFKNPFNSPMDGSNGVMNNNVDSQNLESGGKEPSRTSMAETAFLHSLAKDFYRMLNIDAADTDSPVEIQVSSDGLRVIIYDRASKPMFEDKSSEFTEWGRFVIQNLAWIADRQDFKIRIDGHVAAGFRAPSADYGAWELTTDRANAARREMQHYAVDAGRFERVTGFADTLPLKGVAPDSPENQRIELSFALLNPNLTSL